MTTIKQKKAEDLQQLKKHHLPVRPRLTEKEARKIKKYLRKREDERQM